MYEFLSKDSGIFIYFSEIFVSLETFFSQYFNCFCVAGGMFTANTMSSAIEALGMALPGT